MKTIFVITTLITVACAAALSNRIIGGQIANDGQFPYAVTIKYFRRHRCGGSIINEEWILTAAHCVKGLDYIDLYTVVTGTTTLSEGGDIYEITKFIYHENYKDKGETTVYDIAVIKLATKIVYNAKVYPLPLNTDKIPSGSTLVASGWGWIEFPPPHNDPTENLRYLELKALETKECQERFDELGYPVNDQQLCGIARIGEGVCHGDSGSPLVYNGKIAGIASWVEPCAIGYPDVFTRVSEYIDWLNDTMSKN